MARDTRAVNIGIAWLADPDIDVNNGGEYLIFVDPGDDPNFLGEVDNGNWPETDRTLELRWVFPPDHPADADHAVVSTDGDGRFSSPHSPASYQDIPFGRPPLSGPSGGSVLQSA